MTAIGVVDPEVRRIERIVRLEYAHAIVLPCRVNVRCAPVVPCRSTSKKASACAKAFCRLALNSALLVVQQLAGLVLYAADRVLDLAFGLVRLAFGFRLGIAGYLADALLDLAFDVLAGAFDTILVHVASPLLMQGQRPREPDVS